MFGECHAHLIMDGVNYSHAVSLHKDGVKDARIAEKFVPSDPEDRMPIR